MKCNKVTRTTALGIILVLTLVVVVPANPTWAILGNIELYPNEGRIGDRIQIDGHGFKANEIITVYFSSDEAGVGDNIDGKVTAYERLLGIVSINADGDVDTYYDFIVPTELTWGNDIEDVHGGDYHVYATYLWQKSIVAVTKFVVINGEIELDPKEGHVGTEVEINGEGLRNNQNIIIEYDGNHIDIASGDEQTDSNGQFTCAIIIPESTIGDHTITVIDESGNKPEAKFNVKTKITTDSTSAAVGSAVGISGTGFAEVKYITITINGYAVSTNPQYVKTNRKGTFTGSFLVPSNSGFGTSKVVATDESYNVAEAQLTIYSSAIPAEVNLTPITSLTSPGHIGMELIINGTSFAANTPVNVTFSNGEAITVATVTTNDRGNFSAKFTVPSGTSGIHTITTTDGNNTVTSTFIMESDAPPVPMLLLPEVATTTEAEAYFDWTDVEDLSGVTYTLQIASDKDFTMILLEKKGLTNSEYTITEEEKLESTENKVSYYWRVKAIDGAFNESEWITSGLFYVDFSQISIPNWLKYTLYGIGALLLAILGFWVRRRVISH